MFKFSLLAIDEQSMPSNKKFGYTFSFIFTTTFIILLLNNRHFFAFISLILAVVMFAITSICDKSLSLANKLWMQFGLLLSTITSPVICGLIFIIIFTPLGILMRLAGRDELKLAAKVLPSYWIVKDPTQFFSFKFQF